MTETIFITLSCMVIVAYFIGLATCDFSRPEQEQESCTDDTL
jgi:hypothetical protein